jgi:lipoyl(octanoyl) transferase
MAMQPENNYSRFRGRLMWLGTDVDYAQALELQRQILDERAAGHVPDTVLLLEHAAVYTKGRRAPDEHVIDELSAPLVETDRGGQVTYHGPGQLVGYPIVDLKSRGMGPKAYVRALERSLVLALESQGVAAHTEDGLTGVWTQTGKIAAIGVRITRGIAMHGFALNVSTDLSAYDPIVPCGIFDRPVTSMERVLGIAPQVHAMGMLVAERLGQQLGVSWTAES